MTEIIQNTLEWACTANMGRSPVAELIAREHLNFLSAGYEATSSGSHVDSINRGELSTGFMTNVIDVAKQRVADDSKLGIYTPSDLADINAAISDGNTEQIRHFYKQAAAFFQHEEHEDREAVLPQFGLETRLLKPGQDQTIARPNTLAVFAMADRNLEAIQGIYDESRHKPRVMESLGVMNAFGLGRDVYREVIAQLVEVVPKKVDYALEQVA